MGKILMLLIVLLLIGTVLIIVLYSLLGWLAIPVILVGVIGLFFLVKWAFVRGIKRVFVGAFENKSSALKGAKATIHAVTRTDAPATPPDDDDDDDDEDGRPAEPPKARDYWWIEVTITPDAAQQGSFKMWEPGELALAPPGANLKDADSFEAIGSAEDIEVWMDGEWKKDDGMKFGGEQKLRVRFSTERGVKNADLIYYFEKLAAVELK